MTKERKIRDSHRTDELTLCLHQFSLDGVKGGAGHERINK